MEGEQVIVDLQSLTPWLAIAVSVIALLYAVKKDKSADTDKRFDGIDKKFELKADKDQVATLAGKLDVAEDNITRIMVELDHLPDRNTVQNLAQEVAKLSGDVGVLAERVKPIVAIADRVQAAIFEKAGL